MEITTEKRLRGETVRPALSLCRTIWEFFCLKYPVNEHRNEIIENLIVEQLENEIIVPPNMDFKLP